MTRDDFEVRISLMRNRLLRIAKTKLPESEVEDAVQSAILSAWKHLPQLKNEDTFEPWLRQILHNECMQILRDKKRRNEINASLIDYTKNKTDEHVLPVYEALEEMKPTERELLLMHHEQGYSIHDISRRLGKSEDVVKMRLYRARNRLRVILISMLILLLSMAIAAGTGYLDIPWFLSNRRSEPTEIIADQRSVIDISYNGRYLSAEASDAIWDLEALKLLFTYSLTGANSDMLTVHSGNIGVDGVRYDHVWINDQILPVEQWANGRTVYTYYLDGWRLNGRYLGASEDFLPDSKGVTFLSSLYFDMIDPEEYEALLTDKCAIALQCEVFVRHYATGEIIEQSTLTVCISAPSAEEWRTVYEEYYR